MKISQKYQLLSKDPHLTDATTYLTISVNPNLFVKQGMAVTTQAKITAL